MTTKLKFKTWSNSYANTVDDLKKLGNKIIAVKYGEQGHIITYRHATLTKKPKKGDLVKYYDNNRWKNGLVLETDKSPTMITDHVAVGNTIISLGNIQTIIERQAVPKRLIKYI